MNFVKTKSKSLLMMVLSVMMVLAMMPAMASAGTQVQITSPKTAGSTIYTGESFTLTATPENSDSYHIDWTSSNASVASISKHKGVVTVYSAGDVTFTATVMEGAKPSGTGSGTNCTEAEGFTAATISFTAAETTDYEYHGTGGNAMKMLSLGGTAISDITAGIDYETDGAGNATSTIIGYHNTINAPTVCAGNVSFGFTMSAGVNNFKYQDFNKSSRKHIHIYDVENHDLKSEIKELDADSFDASTKTITVQSESALSAGKYTITFGASVCGNNTAQKLGVPVIFTFTVE